MPKPKMHITRAESIPVSKIAEERPHLCGRYVRRAIGFYFVALFPKRQNYCKTCRKIYKAMMKAQSKSEVTTK